MWSITASARLDTLPPKPTRDLSFGCRSLPAAVKWLISTAKMSRTEGRMHGLCSRTCAVTWMKNAEGIWRWCQRDGCRLELWSPLKVFGAGKVSWVGVQASACVILHHIDKRVILILKLRCIPTTFFVDLASFGCFFTFLHYFPAVHFTRVFYICCGQRGMKWVYMVI